MATGEAVKLGKLMDVFPHVPVVGVKDVRAIPMNVDALDTLGIDVAGNMRALVNDEDGLAGAPGLMRKGRAVKARADDQVIHHKRHSRNQIRPCATSFYTLSYLPGNYSSSKV